MCSPRFAFFILAALLAALACESRPRASSGSPPLASAPASAGAPSLYGERLGEGKAVPLTEVLGKPDSFANQTVTLEGKVRRNCTNKGCWMELSENLSPEAPGCRVTFKNYGFFVPTDSMGSSARVQGVVQVQTLTPDEVDHMESEGAVFARKESDGSAREVRLVATGVELRRGT